MQFSLAYLASDQQLHIRSFTPEEDSGPASAKIISLEEIKNERINLLFYPKDEISEELEAILAEENRFYPIYPLHFLGMTREKFEQIGYQAGKEIFSKAVEAWALHHNLNLLESIFGVSKHLRELLHNDRTAFFEELWFVLKTNLASSELTLIYHDLVMNEEGGKNKLVVAKVTGHRMPSAEIASEVDSRIMSHYKEQVGTHFEILSFDETKGELVATIGIKKSPLVIMAKVASFSKIQRSLMKAIFDGILIS